MAKACYLKAACVPLRPPRELNQKELIGALVLVTTALLSHTDTKFHQHGTLDPLWNLKLYLKLGYFGDNLGE